MKKTLCLVLSLAMTISLCACGGSGGAGSSAKSSGSANASSGGSASSADASQPSGSGAASSQGSSSLDDLPDDAEVTLTIPARFIDPAATQEELDKSAEESGMTSITLNDDGSATYVMTRAKQKETTSQIRDSIDVIMTAMSGTDEHPSIVSIKAEDDYSKFVVTLSTENVESDVPYAVSSFYLSGALYQAFMGKDSDNVTLQYINESTGKEIEGPDPASVLQG